MKEHMVFFVFGIIPTKVQILKGWRDWHKDTMKRTGSSRSDLHLKIFKTITAASHEHVKLSDAVLSSIANLVSSATLPWPFARSLDICMFVKNVCRGLALRKRKTCV